MKITFFSNHLNHHQIPFCNAMHNLLGDEFKFVATEPPGLVRIKLGWSFGDKLPYEIRSYVDTESYQYCLNLAFISDIIIIGSAPDIFIRERLKYDKVTFRYSERFFKQSKWRLLSPRALHWIISNHTRYRQKKLYMLCASAYTSSDSSFVWAYPQKTFKWGYFTEVKNYDLDALFAQKNNSIIKILWCGRFLDWKHPEKAVLTMKHLKEKGYKCELDFIGDGPMREAIQTMVNKEMLNGCIRFLGVMSPEKVRNHMETANIFLFTSDRQEGWGAVLNESMNSGCAIVANQAIGSVPYLIKDRQNGLVYKENIIDDLFNKVEILVNDSTLREKLGKEAIRTMEEWSPKVAAERIVFLCDRLLKDETVFFAEGPCSKA